jgi:hypothetical protein
MAPTTTTIARRVVGSTNWLMTEPGVLPAASTSAQPRNTPRPMPPTTPKVATITDSHRTIERS